MYFYHRKDTLVFEEYELFTLDVQSQCFRMVQEIESGTVMFFHRHPYYLHKTGVFSSTWNIKHFDPSEQPIPVNLNGVSMDNSLLLFKNDKMFIFRNGDVERSERGNVVVIQHPDLNSECTAYCDDFDLTTIYVSLSKKPELFIVQTDTLAMEIIPLPEILDIRYVNRGLLIFAIAKSKLLVGQLPDLYCKQREQFVPREELARAQDERDFLSTKIAELEKKYKRLLMQMGRQQTERSSPHEVQK